VKDPSCITAAHDTLDLSIAARMGIWHYFPYNYSTCGDPGIQGFGDDPRPPPVHTTLEKIACPGREGPQGTKTRGDLDPLPGNTAWAARDKGGPSDAAQSPRPPVLRRKAAAPPGCPVALPPDGTPPPGG